MSSVTRLADSRFVAHISPFTTLLSFCSHSVYRTACFHHRLSSYCVFLLCMLPQMAAVPQIQHADIMVRLRCEMKPLPCQPTTVGPWQAAGREAPQQQPEHLHEPSRTPGRGGARIICAPRPEPPWWTPQDAAGHLNLNHPKWFNTSHTNPRRSRRALGCAFDHAFVSGHANVAVMAHKRSAHLAGMKSR